MQKRTATTQASLEFLLSCPTNGQSGSQKNYHTKALIRMNKQMAYPQEETSYN